MARGHAHDHGNRTFDGIVDNRAERIPRPYVLFFAGIVAWGVLFSGYYLLSGWSSDAEFQQRMSDRVPAASASGGPASTPLSENMLESGRGLFHQHCEGCHGEDAKGAVGPDLTRVDEADYLRTTVARGRGNGMPSFAGRLSSDQVDAIVGYVLSLK